jgi:hypothetical protein
MADSLTLMRITMRTATAVLPASRKAGWISARPSALTWDTSVTYP